MPTVSRLLPLVLVGRCDGGDFASGGGTISPRQETVEPRRRHRSEHMRTSSSALRTTGTNPDPAQTRHPPRNQGCRSLALSSPPQPPETSFARSEEQTSELPSLMRITY